MIEVRVGSIEKHPVTGAPLIALEPRDEAARTRLVLPISPAVACSLGHELEGQTTLRAMGYTLLGQVADVLGGEIAAVEIVPAPNGMAAGRLRVEGQAGATILPVEIALGIGLAVVLSIPLRVAEGLVDDAPKLDRVQGAPDPDRFADRPAAADSAVPGLPAPLAETAADVPDAFRRAFG